MSRIRNKMSAGILALFAAVLVFSGQTMTAFAATGTITFSDPSVTVGDEVSVTMKISTDDGSSLGSSTVMVAYDASALEFIDGTNTSGGAGQLRIVGAQDTADQTTFTFSLNFKALKAGNTALTVSSQEVYDADSMPVSISHVGSSSVTVNASSTASNDNSLASLDISPGSLSPEFSSTVTEYTARVGGSVDSIAISAPANNEKATVSVSGNEDLQFGDNTVTCIVTAEDGSTRTYTIIVTKAESEDEGIDSELGGDGWTIAEILDEGLLPDGFTLTETEFNGNIVQAGIDENGNLLLYLTDSSGYSDLYILDAETGALSPYVTILMAEKTIIVLSTDAIPEGVELPDGFRPCTIDIGNHTVDGWIWEGTGENPEYCMVYGMNEAGEKNFYRYDQKEMTLQRYFEDPAAASLRESYVELAEEYNNLVEDYNRRGIVIAALFVVCVVLLIIIIILLVTRRSSRNSSPARAEKYDYTRDDRTQPGRRTSPQPENRPDTYDLDDSYDDALDIDYPEEPEPVTETKRNASAGNESKPSDDDDFEFIDIDF